MFGYEDELQGQIDDLKKENENLKLRLSSVSGSLPTLDEIKLEPVYGSSKCEYTVVENKLAILYSNQEKILQAIKLLGNRL
jgi:hypothetical protein